MGYADGISAGADAARLRMAAAPPLGCSMRLLFGLLTLSFSLPAATYYLTVTGLGGEPEYVIRFSMVGNEIDKALKSSGADAKVTTLQNATRQQVREAFARISHETKP